MYRSSLLLLSLFTIATPLAAQQPFRPVANEVRMLFAGDIMLDDLPGQAIEKGVDPFAEFADIIRDNDLAVGNLECVVATTGKPAEKRYTFRAHPRVLPVLKKHFSFVSLANNHSVDFGHEAFLEQLTLLEREKIQYVGGGRDCAHARRPLLVERNGVRIALLAYNDFFPRWFEAGPTWPGVAWCVEEQMAADVRSARTQHKADLVIPYLHWGWEHEPENDRQRQLARALIDAGADIVVGGHPHVTQGIEYYQGKLIVYSLGNFVFDDFAPGPARLGWLLRLRFSKERLLTWDTVVAVLDEEGIPHLNRGSRSPCGDARQQSIDLRPTLVDSPLLGK